MVEARLDDAKKAGMTIIRSSQCPHIAKFASDIAQTAADEYHITPTVVELESWSPERADSIRGSCLDLQRSFAADHQISRTRFRNILGTLAT